MDEIRGKSMIFPESLLTYFNKKNIKEKSRSKRVCCGSLKAK
jgi:hypothetical protein